MVCIMGHGLHSTSFTIKHLIGTLLFIPVYFLLNHMQHLSQQIHFSELSPYLIPHFGHIAALSSSESSWKESHYLLLNLYERNHLNHLDSTTDAKLQGHHQFLSLEYYSSLIWFSCHFLQNPFLIVSLL